MRGRLLEFHPAALEELKSAVTWYRDRSEPAAVKFVAELDRGVDLILESPGRWPGGEHATRKFVLRRFPFAVIYREKGTVVEVSQLLTDTGDPSTGRSDSNRGRDPPAARILTSSRCITIYSPKRAAARTAECLYFSAFSIAWVTSFESGVTAGSNRSTTLPFRSTRNFVKFH